MITLADVTKEYGTWLRTLTYERVNELTRGTRWTEWIDGSAPGQADFFRVDGRDVLLPVEIGQHPYIRAVRSMLSPGGDMLSLLLKDTTFAAEKGLDPGDVWVAYLALCIRAPKSDWYVAILMHETLLDPDDLIE